MKKYIDEKNNDDQPKKTKKKKEKSSSIKRDMGLSENAKIIME